MNQAQQHVQLPNVILAAIKLVATTIVMLQQMPCHSTEQMFPMR